MSFYNAFGLPVTTVRPFNTYGPRQSARAIIPTIITQIASGVKQIKLGDFHPTRDFNYVKDICRGFIVIAENESTIGKEINLATDSEISIKETLELIRMIMNSDVEFITEEQRLRSPSSEVFRLLGDNTLIQELTGWQPEITFEEGLRITCDWFSKPENLVKYKPGIYNV